MNRKISIFPFLKIAQGIIFFYLLCFFSFFGCAQKQSTRSQSTQSSEQTLDFTETNKEQNERMSNKSQGEMRLAQLTGIPLPIGFELHTNHADITAKIAAQTPEAPFYYQSTNNTLPLSFSEDLLPQESLYAITQKNQNCFTAQGIGNNKELFFLFQKLFAQNGWNITYEHLNQIGIIKAKKAFQKIHLIIRTHDLYKDQSILHYIIQ